MSGLQGHGPVSPEALHERMYQEALSSLIANPTEGAAEEFFEDFASQGQRIAWRSIVNILSVSDLHLKDRHKMDEQIDVEQFIAFVQTASSHRKGAAK